MNITQYGVLNNQLALKNHAANFINQHLWLNSELDYLQNALNEFIDCSIHSNFTINELYDLFIHISEIRAEHEMKEKQLHLDDKTFWAKSDIENINLADKSTLEAMLKAREFCAFEPDNSNLENRMYFSNIINDWINGTRNHMCIEDKYYIQAKNNQSIEYLYDKINQKA